MKSMNGQGKAAFGARRTERINIAIQTEKSSHSLESFARENGEKGDPDSRFEKVSERILRIDVDGCVWLQRGAAIAYYGDLKFERMPPLKGKNGKEVALREVVPLVSAKGKGPLYCARHGYHLRVIRLRGESINVSAAELLAFEASLKFELSMVGRGISVTTGGFFAIKLSGNGLLALAIHGDPLVLPVTHERPLSTDPHATLAWTAELTPKLKTDLNWRSIVGHGGGEAFQMAFNGEGFVVVQPSEDSARFDGKRLKAMFK